MKFRLDISEQYSTDFSAWINQTAQLLREYRWHEIDVPNLIEEVEDLGKSERRGIARMFYFPDRDRILHFSGESARTTHGAAECIDASRLFGDILFRALSGASKTDILFGHDPETIASPSIQSIACGEYQNKLINDIRGTGYVVESLEAALWCFWTTETYEQAILAATNLGDDADTTAAICGQVAGAYYGESGIPIHWLRQLTMRDEITELAERLQATET